MRKLQYIVKKIFDLSVSLFLLVILTPFFAILSLLIKITSKGPVFFVQERGGKNGKPFKIIKFRTMQERTVDLYTDYEISEDDRRITRIGLILREMSLDELPQLINVVKGDMSLIGPRPTLLSQIRDYDETEKKRLIMLPGITGLAQVSGRNSLTWPEKIKYDIFYVEHWSLVLDIKIMLKTIKVIIKREGLYEQRDNEAKL